MNVKLVIRVFVVALVALLILFEVSFDVRFSMPAEREEPDPEQEARYAACYAERDAEIHDTAFGTIDNPDVQKLYIQNNRKVAAQDCREAFPVRTVTVSEPFRFNLVDLRFRF